MEIRKILSRRPALFAAGLILLLLLWPQGFLRAELAIVRAYQVIGSPVASLASTCRFEPSCSHYALEVLERRGLWSGNLALGKRLLLCSPLGFFLDQYG